MDEDDVSEARVHDHAIIGDCRSAALVDRDGNIDWLCWPRFDSPSLFGSILDPVRGGRFRMGPAGPHRSRREYLEDTNVLATTFEAADGALRLLDAMAVAQESDAATKLLPEHEVLRVAECVRGTVEVELELDARPGYGLLPRRLVDAGRLGIRLALPRAVATLSSTMPLRIDRDGVVRGSAALRAGEAVAVTLAYDEDAPAIVPPVASAPERMARTAFTWRSWCGSLHYAGPHSAAVRRSALVLKLLAFAPSGAIAAAPSTSLPERPGGDLNWDYRFCWLRDAALTVRALYGLGCVAEAAEFAAWLLHTTRLSRPELHVLYDMYGRAPSRERELHHLCGHAGSRPVRVGNLAAKQDQLDVYGEVVAWRRTAIARRWSGSPSTS
jgi:GH15 family glucan-1,4-alpha-glucosidase